MSQKAGSLKSSIVAQATRIGAQSTCIDDIESQHWVHVTKQENDVMDPRRIIEVPTSNRNVEPTTLSGYITHIELKAFQYASESYMKNALPAPPLIIDCLNQKDTNISTVSHGNNSDDNSHSINANGDHSGAGR